MKVGYIQDTVQGELLPHIIAFVECDDMIFSLHLGSDALQLSSITITRNSLMFKQRQVSTGLIEGMCAIGFPTPTLNKDKLAPA